MSDLARDSFEQHHHLHHNPDDRNARRAALVIGVLAAVLAVAEVLMHSAQNAYLARHIGASNEYAFYQARQTRAMILTQTAAILDTLPDVAGSTDPRQAAKASRAEAERLTADSDRGNGAKQILARAEAETQARDVALHRFELFEIVTSALEIAIVLASASVVTRLPPLTWAGAILGLAAAGMAGLVAAGAI